MAFLSIRDAAKRVGRDERTIRRWIENGTIAAHQGVNGRLMVDEADIERARQEIQAGQPPQAEIELKVLLAKVELMGSELQTLRKRVEELESEAIRAGPRREKQVAPPDRERVTSPEKLLPLWTEASTPSDDQPEGTITLQELADELGISRSTLQGHVTNLRNHLDHIPVPIPGRQGQFHRYFNAEQAEQVRDWYQGHSKKR